MTFTSAPSRAIKPIMVELSKEPGWGLVKLAEGGGVGGGGEEEVIRARAAAASVVPCFLWPRQCFLY